MAKKRGIESAEERVSKLENKIKRLEREKKKLLSENKTLQSALEKTEEYVMAISRDKSVEHILHEIESMNIDKECPNCGNRKMSQVNYGEFYIESCDHKGCGYRNRIHEGRPNKT